MTGEGQPVRWVRSFYLAETAQTHCPARGIRFGLEFSEWTFDDVRHHVPNARSTTLRSHQRKRLKAYFLLLAVLLTLLVGVSRVYLGVHWPTDVLAGWTAGAVWALLCWLAARWLQRRHTLERDAEHIAEPIERSS